MTDPAMAKTFNIEELNEAIKKIFGGREEFSNPGKKYAIAHAFLKKMADNSPLDFAMCAEACVIMYEKPVEFILLGKTKHSSQTGSVINKDLVKFLPMHDSNWWTALCKSTKPSDIKTKDKRDKWPTDFKLLNYSCCKTIALLIIEARINSHVKMGNAVESFVVKYPSCPSLAILEGVKMPEQSKAIRLEDLKMFSAQKPFWNDVVEKLMLYIRENFKG